MCLHFLAFVIRTVMDVMVLVFYFGINCMLFLYHGCDYFNVGNVVSNKNCSSFELKHELENITHTVIMSQRISHL